MIKYCRKPKSYPALIALFILLPVIALSGCSDDDSSETSSGGGGGSSTPPASSPPTTESSSIAGTYTGSATATASALGITQSESVPVTITIDNDGTVTIQSGSDIYPNVFQLDGTSFGQSQTFNNHDFGSVTCSGTLTLQGSVGTNGVILANLTSQSVVCNGIPGTVSGSLSAARSG